MSRSHRSLTKKWHRCGGMSWRDNTRTAKQKAVALEKTPSEGGDVDIKLGEEARVSDFMTAGFVRAAADLGRLKKIGVAPEPLLLFILLNKGMELIFDGHVTRLLNGSHMLVWPLKPEVKLPINGGTMAYSLWYGVSWGTKYMERSYGVLKSCVQFLGYSVRVSQRVKIHLGLVFPQEPRGTAANRGPFA